MITVRITVGREMGWLGCVSCCDDVAVELTVRPALAEDAEAMGRVFVDSFHAGHRGQIPDWLLETRTYEVSSRGWARTLASPSPGAHLYVAELDGALAGVGMAGPPAPWPPDDPARAGVPTGECYALYVAPSAQGRGVGAALLRALASRLASDGMARLLVGVLSVNAPARGFYSALGGRLLGERDTFDEGVRLDESVYVWDDIRDLLASASARPGSR
jgi:ribosomal protein S18 acetylase RimI-like enzyme